MSRTKKLIMVALFTTLIIVGAFIKIPTPLIPITLQLAFCLLSSVLLGGTLGATSVLIYVAMGLIGLPVFAYGGGFSYIFKPSFGYNIGFIVAAFLAGVISRGIKSTQKPTFARNLLATLSGVAITYLFGVSYMYFILNYYLHSAITFSKAITYGCLVFLPTDILWCITVSYLGCRLVPYLQQNALQR